MKQITDNLLEQIEKGKQANDAIAEEKMKAEIEAALWKSRMKTFNAAVKKYLSSKQKNVGVKAQLI